MSKAELRWLTDSVERILIPAFIAHGFVRVALEAEDGGSRQIRQAFPFGRLRRIDGERVEQVEIQFDRHGKPVFRINFGLFPRQGIDHIAGHVEYEDVWIHYLDRYFVAYQIPLFRKWFGLFRWPGRQVVEPDFDALADEVVSVISEIEQTLKSGKRGRHIRAV